MKRNYLLKNHVLNIVCMVKVCFQIVKKTL